MKRFKYLAINIDRKKFRGIYFAKDEESLRQALSEQNLFLISCKVITSKTANAFFTVSGKVSLKELTNFSRQLAIMINSLELINCLDILRNQAFSNYFKQILQIVYEDTKSGQLLSEAMSKHKKVFPKFFRDMVYVGEMSSSLEKVLLNVANYYESESKISAKIKSSLSYPITILLMVVGILVVLMIFVIPTFKDSFASLGVEMPQLTITMFNISDYLISNWKYFFLGIAGIVLIFILLNRVEKYRFLIDSLLIKIPFIKKYIIAKVTSKFSRSFGLLLQSGMNVIDSMEVVSKILGNRNIEKKFVFAIEEVRKGATLTVALEKMNMFPAMLIQMISVGEKTACLDEVLLKSCSYFEEQMENALNAVTSLIQPLLMIFMGGIIAVIFIAVYSPMLSLVNSLI